MTTTVLVLSVDLMDRSKISGAYPDAWFTRSVTGLIDRLADASAASRPLVIIDLGRVRDLDSLADVVASPASPSVVGYASHVDDTTMAAAAALGIETLPRSRFFRRLSTAP